METLKLGEYTLANADKFERAVNGTVIDQGAVKGGVGVDATDAEKIAEYDRLGGLILKGKYKVKMGSFYDFKGKKPHAKATPVLVFKVDGEDVAAATMLRLATRTLKLLQAIEKEKFGPKSKIRWRVDMLSGFGYGLIALRGEPTSDPSLDRKESLAVDTVFERFREKAGLESRIACNTSRP